MQDHKHSVSERLRSYIQARQQFTDIREAWIEFLGYLIARNGAGIKSANRLQELETAADYVESVAFEQQPGDDADTAWFQGFERRADVLAALESFLRHRGLGEQPG